MLSLPCSLNIVPPTATAKGVEASPLTAKPPLATASALGLSHPAAPESPDATRYVIPCAAACSAKALMLVKLAPELTRSCSHSPKLSVITFARLLSTM